MADLVIKPSSGNLVLKDDQNVARLTLATSTGATTLTNQVFPAGHTIQTKFAQVAKAIAAISTANDDTEVDSGLRIDFTPVSSSSKIIFTFHAGNAIAQSADILLSIKYHTTSNTAPNTDFGTNYTSGDRQGASAEIFTFNHMHFVDSWSGLRCVSPCYGSSNGQSVCISNATHVTFFRIDEIAQ